MIKLCKSCGVEFNAIRSSIESCSKICSGAIQSARSKEKYPKTKICITCGIEFEVERSYKGSKIQRCSRKCAAANARKYAPAAELLKGKCLKCGVEFIYRVGKRGKFCSRNCSHKREISIEDARYAIKRKSEVMSNPYSNCKSEWVELGGKRFYARSSWEKKYATVLQSKKESKEILDWFYEPDRFWFESSKTFVRSYLPDFLIINIDGTKEYHEVKGFMCKRSEESIRLMAIIFPDVCLKIIDKKRFSEMGLT